jgi:nicotinate-nucleotide adenylyltransferase
MKIGILGGTFNPIHIGHLILADEVREKLKLQKIIFVPTYVPPHKDRCMLASASDRYKMIRLAIAKNRYFSVSDIEIKRKGKSYTIDTVRALKKQYRNHTLYFITGSDLLKYLEEWKDVGEIMKMVKFVVATRPGYPLEKIPLCRALRRAHITTVAIRAVDVSAFEIRQAISREGAFRYLVSDAVYEYIRKRCLYR